MNTKQKNYRLVQALFFVLPIIFSPNSFCNSNNSEMKETVIQITDTKIDPAILVFKEPGEQKITVENHLKKDVDMGNVLFLGDEFTAPLIARDISTHGYDRCSTIKSGGYCSFKISAAKNASNTTAINPDGERLLLNYKAAGAKEVGLAEFKIKVDYNNDGLVFKPRNVEFTAERGHVERRQYPWMRPTLNTYGTVTSSEYYDYQTETQKLTITNNNPLCSINITKILLPRGDTFVRTGGYSTCSNLKSGSSCEVDVVVGSNTKDDMVPIYITYDVVNDRHVVVKKDVVAVAAAIINFQDSKPKAQIMLAIINGVSTAFAALGAYSVSDDAFMSSIIAGELYTAVDDGFKKQGYNDKSKINAVISVAAMHAIFGFISCWKYTLVPDGFISFGACMTKKIGCGLLGSLSVQALAASMHSNTVQQRLPDPNNPVEHGDELSASISLGLAAVLREGCKISAQVEGAGLAEMIQEVYQDAVAGDEMDNIAAERLRDTPKPQSNTPSVDHIFADYDDCNSKECICGYLKNGTCSANAQ